MQYDLYNVFFFSVFFLPRFDIILSTSNNYLGKIRHDLSLQPSMTLNLQPNKDVKLYLWLEIPPKQRKSNTPRPAAACGLGLEMVGQRSKFLIHRLQVRAAFEKTNTLCSLAAKKWTQT